MHYILSILILMLSISANAQNDITGTWYCAANKKHYQISKINDKYVARRTDKLSNDMNAVIFVCSAKRHKYTGKIYATRGILCTRLIARNTGSKKETLHLRLKRFLIFDAKMKWSKIDQTL